MQVDLTRDEILLLISCATYAAEQRTRYQIDGEAKRTAGRCDAIVEKLQKVVNSPQAEANNPVDVPSPLPQHKDQTP